jgi:hypothetical protein
MCSRDYLVDQRMVNPPQERLGVRVGDRLRAGSLILIPVAFLLTTFCVFQGGGGVEVALRLLA